MAYIVAYKKQYSNDDLRISILIRTFCLHVSIIERVSSTEKKDILMNISKEIADISWLTHISNRYLWRC